MTTPTPPPTIRVPRRARRNRESIELFSDFFAASEIGLARARELLQQRRSDGHAELAHELYRIFHAMKGVSTILDTTDITRLAHACELLLAGARSELYPLSSPLLQVMVEATAEMARLLAAARRAVDLDVEIRPDEQLAALLSRLQGTVQSAQQASSAGGEQP
jgi:two-component system chemotaxis sensor kinase CheA